MSDDKLLEKINKLLLVNHKSLEEKLILMILKNNETLLDAVETRIDKKIQESEQRLEKKIDDSQKDTINVLSDLLNTGYEMHEERIVRIETELDLPPLKQKH